MEIDELRAKRYQFLKKLYDVSIMRPNSFWHKYRGIGELLGFDESLTDQITQYLHDEGLIDKNKVQGHAAITHKGINEVERVESNPNQPIHYFPPAQTVIHNSGIFMNSPI